MKVLHISSAKTIRGGEHQVCLLIKELSTLGVTNVLLCPTGSQLSKKEIIGLGTLLTYVKLTPANLLVSAFIRKLVDKEGVDIIHLHDPHSHQFAFYSYKLFANRVPAVVTRRVSFPVKRTSKAYYKHSMIKQIICVSDSVKQSLSNLELGKSKLIVIPSGIELSQEADHYSLREKYNIDSDTKIIANLAAISPQKDYLTFVRAANRFLKIAKQKVKFLIIGANQGSEDQVKSLIEELGMTDKILFTGYISEAHRYLEDVDVLLSTSVSEGLGNTIQEAMKYRIPIVATYCEGTIDLLEHNKSALLAQVGDADQLAVHLKEILTNSDLSKKLTENASNTIQKFDIKETSRLVHNLYKKVLDTEQNN